MLMIMTPLLLSFSMTPIMLSMTLIFFSLLSMLYTIAYNMIPSILSIVVLLVYLGSVMIMSSYVCAVVPNPSPLSHLAHAQKAVLFVILMGLCLGFSFATPGYSLASFNTDVSVSMFLYSFEVLPLFICVVVLMLMTLYTASSFNNCYSPLRSV